MKFAEHLSAHITPEWRKQYINYEEMKAMLYTAVEEAPSAENVETEVLSRHFANFDETFFHYSDQELKKINTFYSEKLAEATRKFATLQSELKSHFDTIKPKGSGDNKKAIPRRKVQELKLAFSEFYLSLILLQNYQNLNYTGFRKILKKHDKLLNLSNGAQWRAEHVETSHFYTNKDIDRLISDTEATVTNDLEGGDRQKAMKKLRVPPLGEQQSPWTTFKVGLFSGSFIVLLITVVLSALFFHESSTIDNFKTAFRLYRGPFLLVEFIFLIGINVYGWRSSGVNHVLIFELDPRNHLSEQHLMELAAIFGVVWALSILSFIYSASLSIPPFVNPLALVIIMIVFLMNPFKVFRHEARFWFLRICGRILAAPFVPVLFADFWLADQWNSFAAAFLDFHYLVALYVTGLSADWSSVNNSFEMTRWYIISRALVNIIPAWTRFWQCLRRYRDSREAFPHLVNAGKYSTTFFVVMFATLRALYNDRYTDPYDNPFLYAWFACQLVSSLYTYTWDVKMDWGLFSCGPSAENKFLREEIVYSVGFYYFAIVEDFVLRFIWIVSFLLTENGYFSGETMVSILAPLEVFRRFIWNFFRLENEHLNNCGKFRAVRDISVAPLDSSDQADIIRMMDHADGVINRLTKKKNAKKTKEVDRKPLLKKESIQDLQLELELSSKML